MIIIILFLFIIGLFLGSFLGVIADRLPNNKSVIKGRSNCDFCKKTLAWYDLVPVLSFLILSGKCRYCKKKLPLFYPFIEVTTGALFALTGYFFAGFGIYPMLFYLFITGLFIGIFFADLKHGIIPDILIVLGATVTFAYYLLLERGAFINHLLTGLGTLLFFISISYGFFLLTKKESMGGGDIKLSFLLGFLLGFPLVVVSLYIAFLTGALLSIILIMWKKKKFFKDSIPFGPFLILGTFISIFFGNIILSYVYHLL